MKKIAVIAALALAACQSQPDAGANDTADNATAAQNAVEGKPVWLHASDDLNVKGTYYQAQNPKALILLFHQADGSKDEYATIGPKLVDAGYSALAIDQRAGGDKFGINETVKNMPDGWAHSMEDAQKDMEGALSWARPLGKPVILWGSSYSASLAIPLANAHPEQVKAVLAFSPGEYFADKHQVGRAASWLKVPIFLTSSSDPGEEKKVKAIADQVPKGLATLYVPENGVHGSATLNADQNAQGAQATWNAVTKFLNDLKL